MENINNHTSIIKSIKFFKYERPLKVSFLDLINNNDEHYTLTVNCNKANDYITNDSYQFESGSFHDAIKYDKDTKTVYIKNSPSSMRHIFYEIFVNIIKVTAYKDFKPNRFYNGRKYKNNQTSEELLKESLYKDYLNFLDNMYINIKIQNVKNNEIIDNIKMTYYDSYYLAKRQATTNYNTLLFRNLIKYYDLKSSKNDVRLNWIKLDLTYFSITLPVNDVAYAKVKLNTSTT